MVLWAALGAVGVTGGGSSTQSNPRAFPEVPLFCLDPHTVSYSWLSCGSSSGQHQQLLSHTGDILGYLEVDPQLLGEKPLLSQQADVKCRLKAAFWAVGRDSRRQRRDKAWP